MTTKRGLLVATHVSANEKKAILLRARALRLSVTAYMRQKALDSSPLPQIMKDEGLKKDLLSEINTLKKHLEAIETRLKTP